jgi:hypothetical protein
MRVIRSLLLPFPHTLVSIRVNGADGISDIEGKVARVSHEADGKRASFNSWLNPIHK